MTTTLRRVKKLLRRSKHVTDQSLLFNQSNCCYVATQKKVMATTYYVIYIYDWLSYITPNIPLVAIPTVIIFPMKLTRKWFLIIVSAVTPVIYRLFIYECSIYSKLGIKKKNLSMKKKTFWYYVCDMMLSKPSSQRVALIWAAAAASRNSPIV